jgi:hypothetical protein
VHRLHSVFTHVQSTILFILSKIYKNIIILLDSYGNFIAVSQDPACTATYICQLRDIGKPYPVQLTFIVLKPIKESYICCRSPSFSAWDSMLSSSCECFLHKLLIIASHSRYNSYFTIAFQSSYPLVAVHPFRGPNPASSLLY